MSEGLNPCPFCGSSAKPKSDSGDERSNQTFWIACTNKRCGCASPAYGGSNTWQSGPKFEAQDTAAKARAILWWNRSKAA